MLNSVTKVPQGKDFLKNLLSCSCFYFSLAENIYGWGGRGEEGGHLWRVVGWVLLRSTGAPEPHDLFS